MLGLKARPKAEIGPDGMTHRQWARRDEAMAKLDAIILERTGIDRDLATYLSPEYLTIAVLLGVKVA